MKDMLLSPATGRDVIGILVASEEYESVPSELALADDVTVDSLKEIKLICSRAVEAFSHSDVRSISINKVIYDVPDGDGGGESWVSDGGELVFYIPLDRSSPSACDGIVLYQKHTNKHVEQDYVLSESIDVDELIEFVANRD